MGLVQRGGGEDDKRLLLVEVFVCGNALLALARAEKQCCGSYDGEYSFYEIEEQNGQILSMKEYSNNVLFTGGVGENHISTYTFQDSEYIDTYNDDCDEIRYYDYDDPYKQEFKYPIIVNAGTK